MDDLDKIYQARSKLQAEKEKLEPLVVDKYKREPLHMDTIRKYVFNEDNHVEMK